MSKDKGTKNIKKAPADKTKVKSVSAYKSEGKIGIERPVTKAPGASKSDAKGDGKP